MKKIVVTGAAGFIGSYLAKTLVQKHGPQKLLLVDDLDAFQRPCAQALGSEIQKFSPDAFLSHLTSGNLNIECIFHIGACSNTEELREDYFQKVNVDYSKTLWRYACTNKTPFLYASSAATYGNGSLGFSDDPELIPNLKPLNPYGWSKQKFDLFALEESKQNHSPPIWAGFKYFNVYGPGEEHKGSQASVVFHGYQQMLKHGVIKLFESDRQDIGHGEQKRDFVYVGDVAKIMEFFSSGQGKNGIYNIGTGQARSFNDLAHAVCSAMQLKPNIQYVPMPPHLKGRYQYFTQANMDRLRRAGYQHPMTSLENGVKLYVHTLMSS